MFIVFSIFSQNKNNNAHCKTQCKKHFLHVGQQHIAKNTYSQNVGDTLKLLPLLTMLLKLQPMLFKPETNSSMKLSLEDYDRQIIK